MLHFKQAIVAAYPTVPLQLTGFQMCHVEKSKRIVVISPPPTSVSDVQDAVGKGKLVLLPLEDLSVDDVCDTIVFALNYYIIIVLYINCDIVINVRAFDVSYGFFTL
jgi:hypothetical protein